MSRVNRGTTAERSWARGGQDAMGGEQVKPGRGDEHAELLDELQRIEQQVRGAVAARVRQLIEELPPGALRQSLQRQRRAQQVAAEVLELFAGVRGQGDIGVEREPLPTGAPELGLV